MSHSLAADENVEQHQTGAMTCMDNNESLPKTITTKEDGDTMWDNWRLARLCLPGL